MNLLKKIFLSCIMSSCLLLCSSATFAEEYGIIDVNKVDSMYKKSIQTKADLSIKEAELQKFQAEQLKKINLKTDEAEKKELIEKFKKDYKYKKEKILKEHNRKMKAIRDELAKTLRSVMKNKGIKVLFRNNAVVLGAQDITDEVVEELNSKTSSSFR